MTTPLRCLIVGGHGYLSTELARNFRASGWQVTVTARRPSSDTEIAFELGGTLPPGACAGFDALVLCAYDFRARSWPEIERINVEGSKRLIEQAVGEGVPRILVVSSISAYDGCRSLYGKAKLRIEQAALAAGGMAIRPGLIYGGSNQAMFGRLQASARKAAPVPLLVGSSCTQYLVHVDDLAQIMIALLSRQLTFRPEVWTVANPQPWPLKTLLEALAGKRRPTFIPVPWPVVWLMLRGAEALGLKPGFKSDSVISIAYQNPKPDFSAALACGYPLRSFGAPTSPAPS